MVTFFVWLTFKLLFVYGTFTWDCCTGGFYGEVSNLDSIIFPGKVVWFIAGFMFDYCGFFTSLWVIKGFLGSYCFVTVELTIGWGLGYGLGSVLGYTLGYCLTYDFLDTYINPNPRVSWIQALLTFSVWAGGGGLFLLLSYCFFFSSASIISCIFLFLKDWITLNQSWAKVLLSSKNCHSTFTDSFF